MRVTIELNDAIIEALAVTIANNAALAWYDACSVEETPTNQDKITLYKAAYRDGMQDLLRMYEGKE